MKNPTLGEKFGRDNSGFGRGNFIREYPKVLTQAWRDFAGALNVSDAEEDTQPVASPKMVDMQVDRRDRLRKLPGTERVELLGRSPVQMALHTTLGERSSLVFFDAPYIGIKREDVTQWTDAGLPISGRQFFWTTFGESFVFGNGDGFLQVIDHEGATVQTIDHSSNGVTAMSMAGRLFVGGAVIEGQTEPLGVAWTGVNGYRDWTDPTYGTGSELLIGNQATGDRIVAMRAMGFDFAAILCRHSVWIGTRTEQLFRPLDFQPRVTGKGCIEELTAQVALGGVVYLSDEGVELFDGTQSQHISTPIDSELVPLIQAGWKFTSMYDALSQTYHLFTTDRTYVLDMLRARWYRRSLRAYAGVPFATQHHAETWDEAADIWLARGSMTWRDTAQTEDQVPALTYLGDDGGVRAIHRDNQASYRNFNVPFVPVWRSQLNQGATDIHLFTTKEIRLSYQGEGIVQYSLPDDNGVYVRVGEERDLPAASLPAIQRAAGIATGKGLGVQIEYTDGDPLVSQVELDYLIRQRRINHAPPTKIIRDRTQATVPHLRVLAASPFSFVLDNIETVRVLDRSPSDFILDDSASAAALSGLPQSFTLDDVPGTRALGVAPDEFTLDDGA